MGYGIGLSGLMSTAEAIDVTSNNIANSQTVGYKGGEYVFSDQFFRAQDPQSVDRAGMGAYRMGIRRVHNYGTVVSSANPLDMAITGPGLFMLAKTVDGSVPTENPTKFQYTRNGQFGVDNKNRVVNQNGMFLVGYPADSSGQILSTSKSVLILDQKPLGQQATKESTIELNVDNRVNNLVGTAFSPSLATSYNQATSQTVFDDKGMAKTLTTYFKKVSSQPVYLTLVNANTITFNPRQPLTAAGGGAVSPANEQGVPLGPGRATQPHLIATTAGLGPLNGAGAPTQTLSEVTITQLTGTAGPSDGSTFNIRLKDGTNIAAKFNTTGGYTTMADRYQVYATLDGVPVASDALLLNTNVTLSGGLVEQQSLGTVAFIAGKNIDSLSRDGFGKPQFETELKIDASRGVQTGAIVNGTTANGGIVQFTLKMTNMTGYSSAAQTYKNTQNGFATAQLASFNIDQSGRLMAQYDNGTSVVKGQVILASFQNLEGLIPNGNNTYEASSESGEALLSFPGDGMLGAVRSKSLEQSNVDLTTELVKLMVLQRQYSAVSQATKIMAATLIDETINIGR
jgi:flagellar hook protein FlgE